MKALFEESYFEYIAKTQSLLQQSQRIRSTISNNTNNPVIQSTSDILTFVEF